MTAYNQEGKQLFRIAVGTQPMKAVRDAFLKREWDVLKALSSTKFIRSSHIGLCSDIISSEVCLKNTGISASDLIKIGAVYVQNSSDVKPRRILSDTHIVEGDLIRLHPFPRKYDGVHDIDWKRIVIHDDDDFIVIDKPAGIPSNPTLDNYYENVFVGLQLGLNLATKLYLPHRLDTDTTGIMLLGKSKDFTTYFGNLLTRRQNITKRYRAIVAADSAKNISDIFSQSQLINHTEKNIPEGLLLTHHQLKSSRSPKIFQTDQTDDSSICQLVLSSKTKPMTRTVREWKKWADTFESEKYDMNTESKFRNAMYCWLGVNSGPERPVLTESMRVNSSLLVENYEEITVNPEEDLERSVTLWEVGIDLLTGDHSSVLKSGSREKY